MLECMIAAEDINYGGMLNERRGISRPAPGMIVHGIGGRHVAMQTVGAPQLWPRLVAMKAGPSWPRIRASPRRARAPEQRRAASDHLRVARSLQDRRGGGDRTHGSAGARRPRPSPAEVVAHPHLAERQAFPRIDHPGLGSVRITAVPFHVDYRPVAPAGRGAVPRRRAYATVLRDVLGYSTSWSRSWGGSGRSGSRPSLGRRRAPPAVGCRLAGTQSAIPTP